MAGKAQQWLQVTFIFHGLLARDDSYFQGSQEEHKAKNLTEELVKLI